MRMWRNEPTLSAMKECNAFLYASEHRESAFQTALEARMPLGLAEVNLQGNNLICGCGGTADALVSGSSVERRVGSNPVIRTK